MRSVIAGIVIACAAAAVLTAQRGRGGAAPQTGQPEIAGGFGATNTLFTMPEAGQGGGAGDPTAEQLAASPEAQAIIANAKRIAGADLADEAARFCTWNAGATVARANAAETVQVFDNLYYAGTGSVGAWIVRTSAGLILWDTLNSEEEAKGILEPGLKKFGIDPLADPRHRHRTPSPRPHGRPRVPAAHP